jgi:hypothetical protein
MADALLLHSVAVSLCLAVHDLDQPDQLLLFTPSGEPSEGQPR